MMNKEILEAASNAQPELMKKTAMAIGLIEKLAPEFMEDVAVEFGMVSDVTMEKLAAVPAAIREKAIGVAAIVGTGVAASLGTAIATNLYDVAKRGLTKARNFKRIMEHNPNLKNEVIDPSRLRPSFNALHRYAPEFTADPLVGGSLLKSLANQPAGNEHNLIINLIGSRKNLSDVNRNQFAPDFRQLSELPKEVREHARSLKEEGRKLKNDAQRMRAEHKHRFEMADYQQEQRERWEEERALRGLGGGRP